MRLKVMRANPLIGVGTALLASGCTSNHAALNPAGPRARQIADLMLLFVGVSTVIYLVVIAFLVWAMLRKRAAASTQGVQAAQAVEAKARRVIAGAMALTVVILITLALADFFVQRYLAAHPADAMRVLLTGHQYWWEVEYDDPEPSQRLHTANELHIPVGRPVELVLTSQDVIHSMWVPNITGKKDLIPGHTNTEVLIAERPGIYSGQCAEFCGLQHAQMRLTVHAEPADQFETWKQQQLAPSRVPVSPSERRGQQVFVNSSCILCHTIQGTDAAATVAPDLTHLASRGTIAAGTLPNTPGNLSSWILAPHRIKPGVQMPATALPPDDLAALAAYLASLQ
jgi:cytochrome c oxidase subunit 2